MVAHRHGSGSNAAGASGATAARGRQSGRGSSAGVATLKYLKDYRKIHKKHLRSVHDSATLTADGFRVAISRAGGYSQRYRFDSPIDRRESGRKPAQAFRETVRGMAVETGHR